MAPDAASHSDRRANGRQRDGARCFYLHPKQRAGSHPHDQRPQFDSSALTRRIPIPRPAATLDDTALNFMFVATTRAFDQDHDRVAPALRGNPAVVFATLIPPPDDPSSTFVYLEINTTSSTDPSIKLFLYVAARKRPRINKVLAISISVGVWSIAALANVELHNIFKILMRIPSGACREQCAKHTSKSENHWPHQRI